MEHRRWVIVLALALAWFPSGVYAQAGGTIAGQVVEQGTQRPLQGARVSVAGTAAAANTNQQGRFAIPNVAPGTRTVQVSLLGYQQATRQVTVGAASVEVNFELRADALGLEELVVVGYGTERRRNVAGAVSTVRAEAVQDIPTPSINNVLQGRVAGVQVAQNSGTPGAAISVRVRGSSSISAGNQPLYVIDGVPMVQGNFSALNANFGGQDIDALSDLNPNEIESIEVLKDASAAAIYGSRASNGVVLITTKRGRAGNAEVNFGAYYGMQREWRRLDFLNTEEYFQIYNEGVLNRFGISNAFGYTNDNIENEFADVEPGSYTDWLDEVLRPAPIANVEGSVRGGTERVRYYVSGGSFMQDGIVHGTNFKRLNGRVNLDYVPFERLTLGTNIGLASSDNDRQRNDNTIYGPFANALANPPYEKVYNEDGTYAITTYANPVGLYKENEAEERSIRILGNTFANYSLAEGLNARGSVAVDQYNLRSRLYDSPLVGVAVGSNGAGSAANSYATRLTYEGTLNFNRLVADQHELSGVAGASYEDNSLNINRVSGQQFPSTAFRYVGSAATITSGTDSLTSYTLQSYFGRLSYTFADRITTTFNIRTDGSSRFGEEHRFGTFPSASVLWRVSEEGFMQNQNFFDNLALRASYGRTGNQADIGNFAARGLFAGGFNYNDRPGLAPIQLANPDLRWETTDQLNLGTDLSIFADRLSISFDYYVKKTEDLLLNRPIPRSTGFAFITSNIGALENRGVELAARAQLVRGSPQSFNWTTEVNLSRNRNKVTALYNDEPINSGFASRIEVGQPIGVFYGWVTDGIFQNADEVKAHARQAVNTNPRRATAPGDIRFKDLNEDGVITDQDRAIIGSPWPDLEGGITNTLSFRGLDLSVFTQFSYGSEIYNAMRVYTDQYGSFGDTHTTRALKRWTPENPNTTEPRAIWGDPNQNTRISDRFIEDGSYLRIKNAVLGYTVPAATASRMGFRNMRVYVQGQNLLTSTNYSGFDPEVNFAGNSAVIRGTDFYTLPQARTVTAGINVGF